MPPGGASMALMMRKACASLGILVAAMAAASPLAVAEHRSSKANSTEERDSYAPLKDCTRLNGRWGYYGNPWCTPAEQRAFDRWEAKHLARRPTAR